MSVKGVFSLAELEDFGCGIDHILSRGGHANIEHGGVLSNIIVFDKAVTQESPLISANITSVDDPTVKG